MAEPIEMQFGTLSWVNGWVHGTFITWGCRCRHGNGHFLGMSDQLKSVGLWGLVKG